MTARVREGMGMELFQMADGGFMKAGWIMRVISPSILFVDRSTEIGLSPTGMIAKFQQIWKFW
jgi:hypothetical protein